MVVHSKQKGAETDANLRLLLDIENPDNPVEIVIHVNMLKEGWDVNNLYTIVPLRTAASKILREQMVGRGLRLPYGERTGDKDVDAVMLTAHDKFQDILAEAQKGDSIFKAGNVIKAEELELETVTQATLAIPEEDADLEEAYAATGLDRSEENDRLIRLVQENLPESVYYYFMSTAEEDAFCEGEMSDSRAQRVAKKIQEKVIEQDKDLADIFKENEMPLAAWMNQKVKRAHREAVAKFIPIPRIHITDAGIEEYVFTDFDLDLTEFNHAPLKNELLIQNLEDPYDLQRIQGDAIDFEGYEPKRAILAILREKPEIDYERCSNLLFKLITQAVRHYEHQFGENGMRNIVMMYKRDIAGRIYEQMMQHFYCSCGLIEEEVVSVSKQNVRQTYAHSETVNLFSDGFEGSIASVLFDGIRKGVFEQAKFDSRPELVLARVLERDADVVNWLRPAPKEFKITYNRGRSYEPDFVVETDGAIYLIEIKGEDKINDPDVIAKKERAVKYCEVATDWCEANGYKPWKHLFIPSKQIMPSSSFKILAEQLEEM